MASSKLTFGGITTRVPGGYTSIDTTALERAGFGATGIVAAVGTANGGRPYTAIADVLNDFQRASDSARGKGFFQKTTNEDLRSLTPPLFDPARDDDIPSGAQEVVYVKVNPATQSTFTLQDDDPQNSVVLTSLDYGAHTTKISVQVEDGTDGAPGKLITVTFEEIVETFDNVGLTPKFTLAHSGTTVPTATATNTATSFDIDFSDGQLGQDSLVTTQATGGASLEVLSDNAADTGGIAVVVYGLDATNTPVAVTATLTGVTPVAVSGTWNLQTGVAIVDATGALTNAAGTVTVRNVAGAVVVFDVPNTNQTEGLVQYTNGITVDPNATTNVAVVADGATTQDLVIRGTNATGNAVATRVTLNGTTPVDLGSFSSITQLELADVEVARTVTLSGVMLDGDIPTLKTVRDLQQRIASVSNVTIAAIPDLDFELANLDAQTATALSGTPAPWRALLDDFVTALEDSQLVSAAKASGADEVPANTTTVFLTGGHEGDALNPTVPTATNEDWQAAFDLLRQIRVNTIVVTSNSAAIHAIADDHCAYMGGRGRSERDFIAGAAADETKAQLKARALGLNSRHARLAGQSVDLFDEDGVRQTRSPVFMAAILAGMQAGSAVGTPLTRKNMKVLGLSQEANWNPADDADEMIAGGIVIAKYVPGVAFQVVRNITTNIGSNVSAYTEASENEALNIFAYEFRTRLDLLTGRKAFTGSANAARGLAEQVLAELYAEKVITQWRNLQVSLVGDQLPIELEVSVVGPINFVPITVHVVPLTETAAAA